MMTKSRLETVFSSNVPVDCYILKGRLETEEVDCFIFDENIVWIHPFRAVAIGGTKLKVPFDQTERAIEIISHLASAELTDKEGVYDLKTALDHEINKLIEVYKIKTIIRNNPFILEKIPDLEFKLVSPVEIDLLWNSEKEYQLLANKKFHFTCKQFWHKLFDFDRSVFDSLRIRPTEFYIEQDLLRNFNAQSGTDERDFCPQCNSGNVRYGHAIDFKLNLLNLILSLLVTFPLPFFRKNYHCFDCGYNFKRKNENNAN